MRIFVVWSPVLMTDWGRPSTATLARVSDARAAQFWDRGRLISHSMGEQNRRGVVWDYIAVYSPGAIWKDRPPEALYHGGPVVRVTDAARAALAQALQETQHSRFQMRLEEGNDAAAGVLRPNRMSESRFHHFVTIQP